MSYTARQQSYIDQFNAEWGNANNAPADLAKWSISMRQKHVQDISRFIRDNPHIFDQDSIRAANYMIDNPLPDNPIGTFDGIGTFFGEFGRQANRVNPFSEKNTPFLWIVGGLAIVTVAAVVAYKVTPKNVAGK